VTTVHFRALRRACMLLLTLAFASLPPLAAAEKTDREQPINFSGNAGGYNYQTKNGALSGNVIITQGTLSIRADRIDFRQNADNSLSATAHGNPVSFRQKRDGYDEYYEGYAQRIEYDGSKQLVELFDRALLKRGQDEIRSAYISYNAATELFKAEGREAAATTPATEAADTRVRGVIQPRSDSALPGKGKGKEPAVAPAIPNPALPLKPAGELAPPAAR
jgi:lipopolysaccharide export system protein LptA